MTFDESEKLISTVVYPFMTDESKQNPSGFEAQQRLIALIADEIKTGRNEGLKNLWSWYERELNIAHEKKSEKAMKANAHRKKLGKAEGGRPRIDVGERELIRQVLQGTLRTSEALAQSGLKPATFYNRLKEARKAEEFAINFELQSEK